jgi:hypothetical protein
MKRLASLFFTSAVASASCTGTTGDALITFTAYASGSPSASKPFQTYLEGGGSTPAFSVQLTMARMHIGALYFDESPPSTGFDTPECITPDIYAAQVPGPVDLDLLSTAPQEFSVYGSGSADVALSWDIWLTDGAGQVDDIDATMNQIPSVELAGVATRLSDPRQSYAFGAVVSINQTESGAGARLMQPTPALPGEYPICKQRILQLGGIHLPFQQGGKLMMTVDPTAWFKIANIDFSNLDPTTGASNAECYLDSDSDATYAGGGTPCDSKGACKLGFVCNSANNNCVQSCSSKGTCQNGFLCNVDDDLCVVPYCIPDTNYGTGPGASAGLSLFHAISGGGSLAYSVTYSR